MSLRDRSGCRFDEVVVATVLPDEQVDAVVRRDRAQLLPGSERVGDRLLDEQVDAVAGEERADLEMKLVRGGDDDAVESPVDQLAIVGVQRHAELSGQRRRTVIEAGQSDQRHVAAPLPPARRGGDRSFPCRRSRVEPAPWTRSFVSVDAAGRRVPTTGRRDRSCAFDMSAPYWTRQPCSSAAAIHGVTRGKRHHLRRRGNSDRVCPPDAARRGRRSCRPTWR